MRAEGMTATVSSIHVNGWYGAHNKLDGARWIARELYAIDLDTQLDRWAYVGDSTNDVLMFEHFPHSAGVANIARFVAAGLTRGEGVVVIATQAHRDALLTSLRRKRVDVDAELETRLVLRDAHDLLASILDHGTADSSRFAASFDDALGVTGLVMTKLDGTAKGGVIAAIAHTRAKADPQNPIPLRFIGVGEGLDDLRPFDAQDFVAALLGDGE